MFRYVVYLKDYECHKKGDICSYSENVCERLIKLKLVKYYKPKKEV